MASGALVPQELPREELAVVDRELAAKTVGDPVVAHLMTIPGVDAIAAISILAAVGDFSLFAEAGTLVAETIPPGCLPIQ